MVLTRTDENELLTALYGALFQDRPWRLFLTRLRARVEADMVHLFIRPAGGDVWHRVDSVEARAGVADTLVSGSLPFETLRGGRVYAGDELAAKARCHARHIRVSWPEGGDLALSVLREKSDFRARDGSLLASLSPHLAIALGGRTELEAERRRSAIAGHALAGFSEGWLLLDQRGRVLDADGCGAAILDAGRIALRGADGRVRFLYAEAETLLEEMMVRPLVPDDARAAWLSVDPPIQMLVVPPPVVPGESLSAGHCLVLMRRMRVDTPADGRFLPALFGLTRSEAALAEHIAGGSSLAEAAEALGLTIETARNYSKRIYVKTGARGQADLVRIVLDGVRGSS